MSKLLKILQKIVSFLHISAAKATPVASKLPVFTGSGDDSTLVHNLGSHPDTSSRHSQIENSVFIRLCPRLFVLWLRLRYSVPAQPNQKFRFHSSLSSTYRTCRRALNTPSRQNQTEVCFCTRLFVLWLRLRYSVSAESN